MKTVMVIDDDTSQLALLILVVLEFLDVISLYVVNKFELGKKFIENNQVDIIISDQCLDNDNKGLDLIKYAKSINEKIATILISSSEIDNAEIDEFILKPIATKDFVEKLKHYLEK